MRGRQRRRGAQEAVLSAGLVDACAKA